MKRKSKLFIAASLLKSIGFADAATLNATTAQHAKAIYSGLADKSTRPQVTELLKSMGLTSRQIEILIQNSTQFDCDQLLNPRGSSSASEFQTQRRLYSELLAYIQDDSRLSALYVKVEHLKLESGGSQTGPRIPAELQISQDGLLTRAIKGLDRNAIFETFRLAAKQDSKLANPAIPSDVKLTLNKASYGGLFKGNRLQLEIEVKFSDSISSQTVSLNIPTEKNIDNIDEVAVAALMTVASSRHLLDRPSFLETEMNAVANVASRLLMSATLDKSRPKGDSLVILQSVIDLLGKPGKRGGQNERFSHLILAKKRLSDYMARTAIASPRAAGLEEFPRTNVFRASSNQSPSSMRMLAPARSRRASQRSDEYSTYYYVYDPLLGYYYPWVYYPGYGYNPFYAPWYYSQILTTSNTEPNPVDYSQQANPNNQSDIHSPLVYQNSTGQVEVYDRNQMTPEQLKALQSNGWEAVTVERLPQDRTLQMDFPSVLETSAPLTEAGRSTATIRVEETAITTTTGDESRSGGLLGGWFSSAPTTTPDTTTTTTTTGTEVDTTTTTTTTTTGVDYTTTTTTTGTDYTTTTTTTGSDYTTTTTTTTTGD